MSSVTTPKTKEVLEAQPHIDIRKLVAGTQILIDTGSIYELKVLTPEVGFVEVSSSYLHLQTPIVGFYLCGIYDLDDILMFDYRIAATLKMKFRFLSGFYISAPAISARLIGEGYHYDVF